MRERGVNTAEGTASRKYICHDWSVFRRSVLSKLRRVADNRHAVADGGHHRKRAINKCLAAKFQKGFIRSHPGALTSSQEEAPARRSILCHMEKHKACTVMHESNLPRTATPTEDGDVQLIRDTVLIMPQKLMDVLMLGRCSHE